MKIEFPKVLYAADGRSVVVNDPDQEAALPGKWEDSPAKFSEEEKSDPSNVIIRRSPGRPRKEA